MSGDARDLFAAYIPDGDVARFAEELPAALAVAELADADEASLAKEAAARAGLREGDVIFVRESLF